MLWEVLPAIQWIDHRLHVNENGRGRPPRKAKDLGMTLRGKRRLKLPPRIRARERGLQLPVSSVELERRAVTVSVRPAAIVFEMTYPASTTMTYLIRKVVPPNR